MVRDAKALVRELRKYDEALYRKPRWLVFNKLDLVPEAERGKLVKSLLKQLGGKRKSFNISALTGEGCRAMTFAVMAHVEDTAARKTTTHRKAAADAA